MSGQEAVDAAALMILKDRYRENRNLAVEYKAYAVYTTETHNPPKDASMAVLMVEHTLRDHAIQKAIHYTREADRFKSAIEAIERETAA